MYRIKPHEYKDSLNCLKDKRKRWEVFLLPLIVTTVEFFCWIFIRDDDAATVDTLLVKNSGRHKREGGRGQSV